MTFSLTLYCYSIVLTRPFVSLLVQGEIDAKQESFSSSRAFGLSLVDQGHFARDEIKANVEELGTTMAELLDLWREKEAQLDQTHGLQVKSDSEYILNPFSVSCAQTRFSRRHPVNSIQAGEVLFYPAVTSILGWRLL